jgi:apolipoprotein D and lipocalin family protein
VIKLIFLSVMMFVTGCTGLPKGVEPVANFDLQRYLGKWYEIARLDHSFEEGLTNVTANYSLRSDGGVKVINRGYSAEDKEWVEAEGKAYFINNPDEGYLKVSFLGPFYGSYVVFGLDHIDYQYSFVCGPNKTYLWLLSRTPTVEEDVKAEFIAKSKNLGFDTSKLIFVKHE